MCYYIKRGDIMEKIMDKEAKLFLTFDMLGDLVRSGSLQWKVKRFRTEDVKDHVFDLILFTKMLKPHFPEYIDTDKMIDYAIVHDLAEVITGDITAFEGVTPEEKKKVTAIAIKYLIGEYGSIMNINTVINEFEEQTTLEAKVMRMLDKVDSSICFMKYCGEQEVDMDNPEIIEILRTNKDVVRMKNEGMDLGEIFYQWHLKAVKFSDEELDKYHITREAADQITSIIKSLMESIHDQVKDTNKIVAGFPVEAMTYRDHNL